MKVRPKTTPRYHDISPEISDRIAVFPGDKPFCRRQSLAFGKGDHLDLSWMEATLHVGAHADAPSHYHPEGESIEKRSLHYYLGPCQVLSAKAPPGGRLAPEHLGCSKIAAQRLLLHTGSFPDPYAWRDDFNSLSPELIHYLAGHGVILVGVDAPSVDPWNSKKLESHNAAFEHDMALLEGLVLDGVEDGLYELIAPPLNIQGGDAGPVRAILKENIE